MYCRTCGNQHGEEVNYCPTEGSMEIAGAIEAVTLEQDTAKYCKGCGSENAQQNLYCQKCGHSLCVVKKKEQSIKLPTMDGTTEVKFTADKAVLKTGFIGGAVASILMLTAGWIGSVLFASILSEMFSKFAKELEMLPSFYSSATSTMLSYHLLGFTASDDSGLMFSLSWHTPFTLLLIIPFIIFSGTGIWLGKQRVAKTIKDQIFIAATVGIIYGVFLFIISFIASQSFAIPFSEAGKITVGYSAIKSLLSGFVCGTLFTLIGFIAHTSKNNMAAAFQELMPYGASIYYGISSMIKGLLVTAVVVCIMALVNKEDSIEPLKEITTLKSESALLALELTPQLWSMAHFAPLEVSSPALSKEFTGIGKKSKSSESTLSFSFISGISVNGVVVRDIMISKGASQESLAEFDEVNNVFHYGLLLLIIPLFLMFRAGRKLAELSTANIYITLAVCSGSYTIMMIVMNMISKFQIDVSGTVTSLFGTSGTVLSMQNSFVYLTMCSFVVTYVAAFVGMKLAKK
ncbi:zinc ribbon domain-containing protein [Bacillus albus]|uniref:zinc ribbon domain-containing protein n=1 Tax=Bacillus albus TaxID=2026189 RepID=UPI001009AFF6|nr:zinc ribbon domain-containing protein [Bacillus albus]RXJ16123.1 zinc ribbon domain-containing protein [Bacillus albus]RXJ25322.1 zinc ribbon domain-containing protein [Bacillus albus]RXJ29374.1 zinc ribbon domain-containing protein [Bacillus albus]RXJ38471.1 zinc ribbon domain-containing protein [Bacillus albus]RXJ54955.1 zinc ribbon domain-containing protein [Bacillus albus]